MEAIKSKKEEIDVRDSIQDYLKNEERDLAWLQRKTQISYGTLYSCFVQRLFKLNDENLKKINDALGVDFK